MRTLALLFLLISPAISSAAIVDFTDGDFSSWTPFSFVLDDPAVSGTGPGTSSSTTFRLTTGGNSDAYYEAALSVFFGDFVLAGGFSNATYNPGTQAPIDQIQLTADLFYPGGGETSYGILIRQDSDVYVSPLSLFTPGPWTTYQPSLFVPTDFDLVGPVVGSPDFSTNGSEMQFGFYFGNVIIGGGSGTNIVGVDNYRIVATAVPEPSLLLPLIAGLAFGGIRRNRPNRSAT